MPDPALQWLVLLTPGRPSFPGDATEAELAAVHAHFAMLQHERDAGRLILAGRTQEDESPLGLAIFEGVERAGLVALMDADPGVRAGVFRYEVRPYRVALLR